MSSPFIDQIPRKSLELTPYQFFNGLRLNVSESDLGQFKKQLLVYAAKNLVRINAYFDSPYLSKFQTDEVIITAMFLQQNEDLYSFFTR